MKNLFLFTFTILCCILVAECEVDFEKWMKNKMEKLLCGKDKDTQAPFVQCMDDTLPSELLEIIIQENEKEDLRTSLEAMCDPDTFNMMGDKIEERDKEFEMTEEHLQSLMECIENIDSDE